MQKPSATLSRWLWLLGIAGLLYLAAAPRTYVGHFSDDARDILAARSLAQGSYSNLQLPSRPALDFPLPGFPALLMPFTVLIGEHWNVLKGIPMAGVLLSLFLLQRLFSPFLSVRALIILGASVAFNPVTLALSSIVISDSFYLVFLLGAFYQLRRELTVETPWGPWLLGGVVAWAGLVRPEGLLLFIALGAALGYARRGRSLIKSWTLPVIVWSLWGLRNFFITGRSSGYSPLWREALAYQSTGFHALGHQFALLSQKLFLELILGLDLGLLNDRRIIFLGGVGLFCLVLLCRGLKHCAKTKLVPEPFILAVFTYVFLHLWLHLLWPAADAHYVWPLLPFLFFFMLQDVVRWKLWARGALGGLLALLYGIQIIFTLQQAIHPAADQQLPQETLAWVKDHTPADAFILTPQASMVALYTGRSTWALIGARDAKDFHRRLQAYKMGYVLLAPAHFMFVKSAPGRDPQRMWERIRETLPASPRDYTLLYENPRESMSLYQVRKGKTPA